MVLTSGRLVEYEGGGDETQIRTHGLLNFSKICLWKLIHMMPIAEA